MKLFQVDKKLIIPYVKEELKKNKIKSNNEAYFGLFHGQLEKVIGKDI